MTADWSVSTSIFGFVAQYGKLLWCRGNGVVTFLLNILYKNELFQQNIAVRK